MTGKGHIISGSILMADTYLCSVYLSRIEVPAFLCTYMDWFTQQVNPMKYYESVFWKPVLFGVCVFFYYFGLLLPDIDTDSMISKWLHFKIPLRHRGFTHSIWFICIFLIPGIFLCYPFRFLAIGMLVHGFMDHFSKAGWVLFYPIGKYKCYDETVFNTRKHLVFYSAKVPHSEILFNAFLFLLSFCTVLLLYFLERGV